MTARVWPISHLRSLRLFGISVLIFSGLLFSLQLAPGQAPGQFTQQGSKLVGTGAVGNAQQGSSVALSGDGNTVIVGGPHDNSNAGAAWDTPAATVSGPGRATRWSGRAWLDQPFKAARSRCPPTATPPSWVGLETARTAGRHGSSVEAMVYGPSKAAS